MCSVPTQTTSEHAEHFGVIHWSRYTDKPGKTDLGIVARGRDLEGSPDRSRLGNTQYVEPNQTAFQPAMMQSSMTPFAWHSFPTSERFTSLVPVPRLKVTRATPDGVLGEHQAAGSSCLLSDRNVQGRSPSRRGEVSNRVIDLDRCRLIRFGCIGGTDDAVESGRVRYRTDEQLNPRTADTGTRNI
jgi:hypothetical protein